MFQPIPRLTECFPSGNSQFYNVKVNDPAFNFFCRFLLFHQPNRMQLLRLRILLARVTSNRTRDVKVVEGSSEVYYLTRIIGRISLLWVCLSRASLQIWTRTKDLLGHLACTCFRRTQMELQMTEPLMISMVFTLTNRKGAQRIRRDLTVESGHLFGVQIVHMLVMSLYHRLPVNLHWILLKVPIYGK